MLQKYFYKLFLLSVLFCGSAVMTPIYAQNVLTSTEQNDLEFMREEEKLARDVYTRLYAIWGSKIFNSISISEQTHTNAVLSLLNFYGIADPAAGNAAGVFTNVDLQELYDDLVEQGGVSEIGAMEVGFLIEETDILDLENAIASTNRSDIIRLYSNLLRGSLNHLSAFTNNLEFLGGTIPSDNQNENVLQEGTSVYEPISQTLYIPAVDVMNDSGEVIVYDVLLRLMETLPQALEVVSVTEINNLPNSAHASFDSSTGILSVPDLTVGTLVLPMDGVSYSANLELVADTGAAIVFVVTQVQSK